VLRLVGETGLICQLAGLKFNKSPKNQNLYFEVTKPNSNAEYILVRSLREMLYQMKSSTKKIIVIGVIVLFIVSIIAGWLH
jgi:hypothetical protein